VQLSDGSGDEHLVRFARTAIIRRQSQALGRPGPLEALPFRALRRGDHARLSGDHGGAALLHPTASRLVRTYTDRRGLKDLVKELVGTGLSKQQQTSDWGAAEISDAQRNMPPAMSAIFID
jgi:ribonuclease D